MTIAIDIPAGGILNQYYLHVSMSKDSFPGNCGIRVLNRIKVDGRKGDELFSIMQSPEQFRKVNEKEAHDKILKAILKDMRIDKTPRYIFSDRDFDLAPDGTDRAEYFENLRLRALYEETGLDLSFYKFTWYHEADKIHSFFNPKSGRQVSMWAMANPYAEG